MLQILGAIYYIHFSLLIGVLIASPFAITLKSFIFSEDELVVNYGAKLTKLYQEINIINYLIPMYIPIKLLTATFNFISYGKCSSSMKEKWVSVFEEKFAKCLVKKSK